MAYNILILDQLTNLDQTLPTFPKSSTPFFLEAWSQNFGGS